MRFLDWSFCEESLVGGLDAKKSWFSESIWNKQTTVLELCESTGGIAIYKVDVSICFLQPNEPYDTSTSNWEAEDS